MDGPKIIKRLVILIVIFLSPGFVFAANPPTERKTTYAGVLYGYIHDIRPDFSAITVKPISKDTKRLRIYLDPKTQIFVDHKRKQRKAALYLGDKVAIRYFASDNTIIADAVFVVFGKFVPKDYLERKKLKVFKKETEEKGKEGGGHGSEAKKETKSGGH